MAPDPETKQAAAPAAQWPVIGHQWLMAGLVCFLSAAEEPPGEQMAKNEDRYGVPQIVVKELLTKQDAAFILGVGEKVVNKWIEKGLPTFVSDETGKRARIRREALFEFLRALEARTKPPAGCDNVQWRFSQRERARRKAKQRTA